MPAFVLQQKADAAAVDAREAIADKQAVAAGKDAAVTVVRCSLMLAARRRVDRPHDIERRY